MADRVDAMRHGMQPAYRHTMFDGSLTQPKVNQLPPPHHPMLPLCQGRHCSVCTRASPSQPTYIGG